jgi:ribosomal protein S18 acetylase RimI-like enzyme
VVRLTIERISAENAHKILARDEEQNRYAILRLLQGGIAECWAAGESLCLWDSAYDKYCFFARDSQGLRALYDFLKPRKGPLISLIGDDKWLNDIYALGPGVRTHVCAQFTAAPHAGDVPAPEGVRLGGVTEAAAKWMLGVYAHEELTYEFIMRRGAAGPAVVAYRGDAPVGFFLTHSEAELGPVYVEPAMRGSGLADAMYAKIMESLPQGEPAPVLFVLEENQASQKWLGKAGCKRAARQVVWFWREYA